MLIHVAEIVEGYGISVFSRRAVPTQRLRQIFPPTDEFVNLHPFTLHLWELASDERYANMRTTVEGKPL